MSGAFREEKMLYDLVITAGAKSLREWGLCMEAWLLLPGATFSSNSLLCFYGFRSTAVGAFFPIDGKKQRSSQLPEVAVMFLATVEVLTH